MNGTVLGPIPRGFQAQMDTAGKPTGVFKVTREDGTVVGTAVCVSWGINHALFRWSPCPDPMPVAWAGDTVVPG